MINHSIKENRMNNIFNITKKVAFILITSFSFSVLSACSEEDESYNPDISHEINDNLDFTKYKTFSVINPLDKNLDEKPPQELIDVMDELISEITRQMKELGLKEDNDNPDLQASPFVKGDYNSTPVTFYDYFYGYYWGYEYTWTVEVNYTSGSLIIDVVDTHGTKDKLTDDELAFRGTVSGIMGQDIDVIQLQLRNAVDAIFKGWPKDTSDTDKNK